MKQSLTALQRRLGYKFKDSSLLVRALTHSSASAESNNEQLEFLGDSVIQLAVTAFLYSQGGDEGEMTARRQQLVSHEPLKAVAEELGLAKMIVKANTDIGKKAYSSVYEAVAGAIFSDGGYAAAEEFVRRTLLKAHTAAPANYKGELQELLQARHAPLPQYNTVRTGGTPNAPGFTCTLIAGGMKFTGSGGSKAEAERNAARAALSKL